MFSYYLTQKTIYMAVPVDKLKMYLFFSNVRFFATVLLQSWKKTFWVFSESC